MGGGLGYEVIVCSYRKGMRSNHLPRPQAHLRHFPKRKRGRNREKGEGRREKGACSIINILLEYGVPFASYLTRNSCLEGVLL